MLAPRVVLRINLAMINQAPSSALSRSFAEQGLKLRLRKGGKYNMLIRTPGSKRDGSESSESESVGDSEQNKPKKSKLSAPTPSVKATRGEYYPEQDYYANYPMYAGRPPPPSSADFHPYAYPMPPQQSRAYPPQGPPPNAAPYWPPYYSHYPPPPQGYQARPPPTADYQAYQAHSSSISNYPSTSNHHPHSATSSNPISPTEAKPSNTPINQRPGQPRYSPAGTYIPIQPRRSEHEPPINPTAPPKVDTGMSREDNSTSEAVDEERESASWEIGSTKKPRFESPKPNYEAPHEHAKPPPANERRPSASAKPQDQHYHPYGYPPYPPPQGYPGYYPPPPGNYPPRPPPGQLHSPYPYPPPPQHMYYPEMGRYPPSGGFPPRQPVTRPRSPNEKTPTEPTNNTPDVWPSPRQN